MSKQSSPKLLGIGPATGFAKLSPETLLWAHQSGLMRPLHRVHGSRLLPAFDPEELLLFADDWRSRIAPKSLGEELNLPFHGIEQLAVLGIIPATAPAMPDTGPHFYPDAIDTFLDDLERAAIFIGTPEDGPWWMPLSQAMRKVIGRAKPWGPVLSNLLDGTLPFAIRAGEKLADSIFISPADEDRVITARFDRGKFDFPFSDRINLMEALDLLNLGHQKRAMLDGLAFSGINPRSYLLSEVEELARKLAAGPS